MNRREAMSVMAMAAVVMGDSALPPGVGRSGGIDRTNHKPLRGRITIGIGKWRQVYNAEVTVAVDSPGDTHYIVVCN